MSGSSPFLDHCGPLLANYDILLCDVWGVIHNGVESFPAGLRGAAARAAAGHDRAADLEFAAAEAEAVVPQLDGLKCAARQL